MNSGSGGGGPPIGLGLLPGTYQLQLPLQEGVEAAAAAIPIKPRLEGGKIPPRTLRTWARETAFTTGNPYFAGAVVHLIDTFLGGKALTEANIRNAEEEALRLASAFDTSATSLTDRLPEGSAHDWQQIITSCTGEGVPPWVRYAAALGHSLALTSETTVPEDRLFSMGLGRARSLIAQAARATDAPKLFVYDPNDDDRTVVLFRMLVMRRHILTGGGKNWFITKPITYEEALRDELHGLGALEDTHGTHTIRAGTRYLPFAELQRKLNDGFLDLSTPEMRRVYGDHQLSSLTLTGFENALTEAITHPNASSQKLYGEVVSFLSGDRATEKLRSLKHVMKKLRARMTAPALLVRKTETVDQDDWTPPEKHTINCVLSWVGRQVHHGVIGLDVIEHLTTDEDCLQKLRASNSHAVPALIFLGRCIAARIARDAAETR